jgi:hypothetical protein
VDRDPFTRCCGPDEDPLGDLVVRGNVDATLLTGIAQRHQQTVPAGGLAQQHARGSDMNGHRVPEYSPAQSAQFGTRAAETCLNRLCLFAGKGLQHHRRWSRGRLGSADSHHRRSRAIGEQCQVLDNPIGAQ